MFSRHVEHNIIDALSTGLIAITSARNISVQPTLTKVSRAVIVTDFWKNKPPQQEQM